MPLFKTTGIAAELLINTLNQQVFTTKPTTASHQRSQFTAGHIGCISLILVWLSLFGFFDWLIVYPKAQRQFLTCLLLLEIQKNQMSFFGLRKNRVKMAVHAKTEKQFKRMPYRINLHNNIVLYTKQQNFFSLKYLSRESLPLPSTKCLYSDHNTDGLTESRQQKSSFPSGINKVGWNLMKLNEHLNGLVPHQNSSLILQNEEHLPFKNVHEYVNKEQAEFSRYNVTLIVSKLSGYLRICFKL